MSEIGSVLVKGILYDVYFLKCTDLLLSLLNLMTHICLLIFSKRPEISFLQLALALDHPSISINHYIQP